MNWTDKTVIRILLLVAKLMACEPWKKDIEQLTNHITVGPWRDSDLCRAEKAEQEIKTNLELIPAECRVIVREGGGPENNAASLAVSIAKLAKAYKERT
jgi:hypothetical protein